MKKWMKRGFALLMVLSIFLCCGCGKAEERDDSLWVQIGIPKGAGGNTRLVERVIEKFQQAHPDVPLRVEYLPAYTEERELYLEQLRTKIMAGRGPDVYLMFPHFSVFADVEQSMHNGLFLDISPYYEADTALPKDGFAQGVKDGGVVDGARYILPLYYNFPVLYVDTQKLTSAGISLDTLGNGLSGLAEVIRKLGDTAVVSRYVQMQYYLPNFFAELIDYETQEVTWSKSRLVEFLTQYRELLTQARGDALRQTMVDMSWYIKNDNYWAQKDGCVYLGTLNDLVDQVRMAKATNTDLAVIPVTAADGSVCATVSHLGAIGANTDKPELAYEFLRGFALQENQWENDLADIRGSLTMESWPVLAKDSWEEIDKDLWQGAVAQTKHDKTGGRGERISAIASAEVCADDYAVLNTEISKIYLPFYCGVELMTLAEEQLNPNRNPNAAGVDVEALADRMISQLQWLLAEG